jgi:hemolysin activation/secretion protein
MRNLSLELAKALLGTCLLAGHVFASAKTVSFSESLTTTHCLFIEQLELADLGGNKLPEFDWLRETLIAPKPEAFDGACLGPNDIDALIFFAQRALIEKGFVTTRVLFQTSTKKNDPLVLTIVPGRIRTIRFENPEKTRTDLHWAFPMKAGDLLNVRDIEQALENLKRIPTADADIKIVPSSDANAEFGDSDLWVSYQTPAAFRVSITLDDSGTRATGRYQSSVTFSADNPLQLNDLFYATHNNDLGGGQAGDRGTHGDTFHYSIPFGYSLISATFNKGSYYQSVASQNQSYVYRGISENNDLKFTHVFARDAGQKWSLTLGAFQRKTRNYIDDTEIQNQQRVEGGWYSTLSHKAYIESATLDSNLTFKRGTHAFGALAAPEEAFGEGTSQFILLASDVNLSWPFQIDTQRLRYNSTWRLQSNRTALTPPNRLSIGGRYSVRGFDGELVLTGDAGWIWRNDVGFLLNALDTPTQEFYVGLDHGEVAGQSTASLVGTRLAGLALGFRGLTSGLSYDIFLAQPLSKPTQFATASSTMGFSVTANF